MKLICLLMCTIWMIESSNQDWKDLTKWQECRKLDLDENIMDRLKWNLLHVKYCTSNLNAEGYLTSVCYLTMTYLKREVISSDALVVKIGLISQEKFLQPVDQRTPMCLLIANATIYKTNIGSTSLTNEEIIVIDAMKLVLESIDELHVEIYFYKKRSVGFALMPKYCSRKLCKPKIILLRHLVFILDILDVYLDEMNNIDPTTYYSQYNTYTSGLEVIFFLNETVFHTLKLTMHGIINMYLNNPLRFLNNYNITTILLPRNNIDHEFHLEFPYLPQTLTLSLEKCKIPKLFRESLINLPNLTKLVLSSNNLGAFPKLSDLRNLQHLDISKNKYFGSFHSSQKFEVLEFLNVSNTILNGIKSYHFQSFPSLNILDLKGCQINVIEKNAFSNLVKLEYLDLSNNRFETIEANVFTNVSLLRYLDLSENKVINLDFLSHSFASYQFLNASYNRLTSMPFFSNTIQNSDLSNNEITTWDTARGAPAIHCLNLGNNKISTISKAMSKDLRDVKSIHLEGNALDCDSCSIFYIKEQSNRIVNMSELICYDSDRALSMFIIDNEAFINAVECWDKLPMALSVAFGILLLISIAIYYYRWQLRLFLFWLRTAYFSRKIRNVPFEYDAFVAYNTEQRFWVDDLLNTIGEEEYKFCIHQRDFVAGVEITDNIVRSIEASRLVLILLSQNFIDSSWCMRELEFAQSDLGDETCKSIVVVKMGKLKNVPKRVKHLIKTRTYLEWPQEAKHRNYFWERLKIVLARHKYEERHILDPGEKPSRI